MGCGTRMLWRVDAIYADCVLCTLIGILDVLGFSGDFHFFDVF